MVFTTNKLPQRWGPVLHDDDLADAIVDRILDRGRLLRLDGPSIRTKHLADDPALNDDHDETEELRFSGKSGSDFPEPATVVRRGEHGRRREQPRVPAARSAIRGCPGVLPGGAGGGAHGGRRPVAEPKPPSRGARRSVAAQVARWSVRRPQSSRDSRPPGSSEPELRAPGVLGRGRGGHLGTPIAPGGGSPHPFAAGCLGRVLMTAILGCIGAPSEDGRWLATFASTGRLASRA